MNFAELNESSLILTPNRRLSATLQRNYAKWQQSLGRSVWPSLNCVPLTSWLVQQWQYLQHYKAQPLPSLLSKSQESALWSAVISEDETSNALLNVSGTSRLVSAAWQQLRQWQIDSWPTQYDFDSSKALLRWSQAFLQRCQQLNVMSPVCLPEQLQAKLDDLLLPEQIILFGFDELTPNSEALFAQMRRCGIDVNHQQFEPVNGLLNRYQFADGQAQLRAIAKWAARQQAAGVSAIACVFPQLASQRDDIERAFATSCSPGSFELSAGVALADEPLVNTALQILKLLITGSLPRDELLSVIRSPFFADHSEWLARAAVDEELRAFSTSHITIKQLKRLIADNKAAYYCPKLLVRLHQLTEQSFSDSPQAAKQIAHRFHQQLTDFAWPGERCLSSREYQACERFFELLDELAACGQVLGLLSARQGLNYLQQLARNTLFQVESEKAPIQVLGILEAAGNRVDKLWVADLDDETWPQAAKPNPYIPLAIARRYQLPHSSAERELAFSLRLTERFKHSAAEVHFSHAMQEGERQLQVSPLISDIALSDPPEQTPLSYEQQVDAAHLEPAPSTAHCHTAAGSAISGGSFVLQSQSDCPFQAFARFRLKADTLAEPSIGPSALDRGIVIHDTLASLWQELKTQQALLTLSSEQRQQLIERHLSRQLARLRYQVDLLAGKAFWRLEMGYLRQLIERWLQLECERPRFSVESVEQSVEVELAGVRFHLRVDRIDVTASGERYVIDYKTGKTRWQDWFEDRIRAPQLPLYCLAHQKVSALLYANISSKSCFFSGVSKDDSGVSGVVSLEDSKLAAESWELQVDYWRLALQDLAQELVDGVASVTPRSAAACTYCEQLSLCRINEQID